MQNKFVRVGDVALYFDVTPETIRSWIKKRGLPARKISGQWRLDWNEIKTGMIIKSRRRYLPVDTRTMLPLILLSIIIVILEKRLMQVKLD